MLSTADVHGPFRPVRAATTLAVWGAARQAGTAADSVLEALAGIGGRIRAADAELAEETGLPGPGENLAGPVELMSLLRVGGRPGLVLPRPGDVRGLPAGGELTTSALAQGAAVVLPEAAVGLVQVDGVWRVHRSVAPFHPALAFDQARSSLDEAVQSATEVLTAAGLERNAGGAREAIARLMLAERVDLPPAVPPRASSLLATAISVESLLRVSAAHDPLAAGVGGWGLMDAALRPLADAVREARRTAVDLAVAALLR